MVSNQTCATATHGLHWPPRRIFAANLDVVKGCHVIFHRIKPSQNQIKHDDIRDEHLRELSDDRCERAANLRKTSGTGWSTGVTVCSEETLQRQSCHGSDTALHALHATVQSSRPKFGSKGLITNDTCCNRDYFRRDSKQKRETLLSVPTSAYRNQDNNISAFRHSCV